MFLYADLADSVGPVGPVGPRLLMNFCALTAHVLHTIVAYMVLMAAWPDDHHDEEALLPGKFRSTLYLDVFGWLLNPTGPGPRRNEREDDDDEVRSMRSFMGSRQDNVMPSASPPSAASAASAASASPPRPVSLEPLNITDFSVGLSEVEEFSPMSRCSQLRSRWDSASAVSFRGSTSVRPAGG
ncbi:unnamed protein product [Cladocopium goreaui]|uniref:Uncharacterized protein n=1 Tax=Cladocopium goreaui TaxID=2562237 RepID=A0A9P1GB13_9DINO|nr:unnamed protein product [Cladocopium goreaui]